jgi:alkaline phosphatase
MTPKLTAGGVRNVTVVLALLLAAVSTYFGTRRLVASFEGREDRGERAGVAVRGETVAPAPPALADGPVKNVVLLIGDGMGGSQIAAGRIHTRGPAGRLALERLPVTGLVNTWPEGGLVSKSDAAATALATGVKTRNDQVGMSSNAPRARTILEALRDAGYATGLVTTTRITDATPAAFAAHVAQRRMQIEIAEQIAAARVDLLVGGGRSYFLPRSVRGGARGDGRDLLEEMRRRGVAVVDNPAGLASATGLPLAAIFDAEPQVAIEDEPAAAIGAMATKAIALLAASGRPFFVMIEEEGIDTKSHANDIEAMAAALERFDEAVGAAVDFAARDGRTLVLVTGDHSTGGPMIDQRSSARELRLIWESGDHTGEPVPVFAYGPRSAALRFTGVIDNTEIPARIMQAVGVEFTTGEPR